MLTSLISTVFTVIGALYIGALTIYSRKARRMSRSTRILCAVLTFVIFKVILDSIFGVITNIIDPFFDSALEIIGGGFDAWH